LIQTVLLAIRLYRRLVSPLLPPACRYWPSCSEYAEEAFDRHGPWPGLGLTVRRLLKCHPWGGHGVDLVPPAPARDA
jgi:putative membrane protein insertion efficiency factor